MVIIRLMGGLGNQMQQYALYHKFISMGKEACLDTSWFAPDIQQGMKAPRSREIDTFPGVSYKEADASMIQTVKGGDSLKDKLMRKVRHSVIVEDRMYYPDLLDRDNVYLEGYWAAEKYYRDEFPLLRKQFSFDLSEMSEEARRMVDIIQQADHPVSVHIRRGDYLDPENMALFGNIATDSYYEKAFSYIRETIPGAVFFIFSDDPGYTAGKYGQDSDCHIVNVNHGDKNRFDMYLMSLCTSHICANSTFSFWGARLDPTHGTSGVCIRPTIQKNTQTFDINIMRDLWRWWTFIDPNGKIYEV